MWKTGVMTGAREWQRAGTAAACAAALMTALGLGAPGARAGDWGTDRGGADRAGIAAEPGLVPPLGKRWERDFGAALSAIRPVDGTIVVGIPAGSAQYAEVRAVDPATGKDRWARPLTDTGSRNETLLVSRASGTVIVSDNLGVHAYRLSDGSPAWSFTPPPGQSGTPEIGPPGLVAPDAVAVIATRTPQTGEGLVSAAPRYGVHVLDAGTGATRAVLPYESELGVPTAAPLPGPDGSYIVIRSDEVRRLGPSGTVWVAPRPSPVSVPGGAILGDRVRVENSGETFSVATGASLGTLGQDSVLTADTGAIYGSVNGALQAIELGAGTTRWSTPLSSDVSDLGQTGAWLWLTDRDRVTAYATADGRPSWSAFVEPGARQGSSTPIAAGGGLLLAGRGSRVTAFGPGPDAPGLSSLPRRPAGASFRFKADRKSVLFPAVVKMQASWSASTKADTIVLEADPAPFDGRYGEVARKRLRNGEVGFSVRPQRNTRYRVRNLAYQDVVSGVREVLLDYAIRARYRFRDGGRTLLTTVTIRHPEALRMAGRTVHMYLTTKRSGRLPLRDSARLRRVDATTSRARLRFRVPLFRRTPRFAICIPERKPDAYGRVFSIDKVCGRKRI